MIQQPSLVTVQRWIEHLLWMVACLTLISITGRSVVGGEGSEVWRTDFNKALTEAEERQVPLLVHFYADWCMPCQRMERDVFPKSAIRDLIGQRFVGVKLNSDHHQDLVKRYGVETLPSDLVIDSLTGKVLLFHSGYSDVAAYLQMVSQAESRFHKVHFLSHKRSPDSSESNDPKGLDNAKGSADVELGDAQPIVGLDGFSPVAISKNRKWVRGSARFAWDFKDITYYMSSREELEEFRNDPESMAPKLLGCDPVILWETDRAVAGDVEYGAFFDGELYLFKTDERRQQFKANPEKFIRLQHALKSDQVERSVLR